MEQVGDIGGSHTSPGSIVGSSKRWGSLHRKRSYKSSMRSTRRKHEQFQDSWVCYSNTWTHHGSSKHWSLVISRRVFDLLHTNEWSGTSGARWGLDRILYRSAASGARWVLDRTSASLQVWSWDSHRRWRTSGLSYPPSTPLITVPNDAIRRKIKRRDFLPTRSFSRHPSCPVSFLLSAYGTTIDNNVMCICWHQQLHQLRGLTFGATPCNSVLYSLISFS